MKKQITLLSLACMSALAADPIEANLPNGHVSLGFGTFSAKAYERVYGGYGNDHKLSQLDWRVKNAFTLNANADFRLRDRFEIKLSGWVSIDDSTDTMDDYDWLNPSTSQYSDKSTSDCVLDDAVGLDASIGLYLLNEKNCSLGVMAGFEHISFSMHDEGGRYWYNFGTECGSWPDGERGIEYEQIYNVPYVGLMGSISIGPFDLEGRIKYSSWVSSEDEDFHVYVNKRSMSEYDSQEYLGLSFSARWNVTDLWAISATIDFREFSEERGDNEQHFYEYGEIGTWKDGASIESSMTNFSLAATYAF